MDVRAKLEESFKRRVGTNSIPHHHCLQTVQDILEDAGIHTRRVDHAYQFPSVCMNSQNFIDQYSRVLDIFVDLKKQPKWTIVVWNKTKKNPSGHIEFIIEDDPKINRCGSDYIQFERKEYDHVKIPLAVYVLRK
jgi:hypothetical protein